MCVCESVCAEETYTHRGNTEGQGSGRDVQRLEFVHKHAHAREDVRKGMSARSAHVETKESVHVCLCEDKRASEMG